MSSATLAPCDLSHKERRVLSYLSARETATMDEFVRSNGLYIPSWSGVFTSLLKRRLIARTGAKRPTFMGGKAHVLAITDEGKAAL